MLIYFYVLPTLICVILGIVITWGNILYPRDDFERDTRGRVLMRFLVSFVPLLNMAALVVYVLVIIEITGVNEWLDKDFCGRDKNVM